MRKIGWTLFQPPVKEDWYLCRLFCAVDTPKEDFFSTSESLVMFSLLKRHILSKEEGEEREKKNISLFNYPQLLHLSHPPQVSFPRRKRKREGMLFTLPRQHASLLILLLSFRRPLLCMKQRGRLKAFSGHSDNEERRSSELY